MISSFLLLCTACIVPLISRVRLLVSKDHYILDTYDESLFVLAEFVNFFLLSSGSASCPCCESPTQLTTAENLTPMIGHKGWESHSCSPPLGGLLLWEEGTLRRNMIAALSFHAHTKP